MNNAIDLIWEASGKPEGKFPLEDCNCACATSGKQIIKGVATKTLAGDAFSRQSDFLRFGDHVSEACGWMYSYPKITHRNLIAYNDTLLYPMISHDSANEERPSWLNVLKKVSMLPRETSITGIITTDPKPRLWPLLELTTVGNFGMYIYNPDYDTSGFRYFDLNLCLKISKLICSLIEIGFNKKVIYFSLFKDLKKAKKDLKRTISLENKLKGLRTTPEFLPALIISGKKKAIKPNVIKETPKYEQGNIF